jgi:hypothetical protein
MTIKATVQRPKHPYLMSRVWKGLFNRLVFFSHSQENNRLIGLVTPLVIMFGF